MTESERAVQRKDDISVPPVFHKYAERGPYHWADLSKGLRKHQCYTAARYAIILDLLGNCRGKRVLDVGCGDGALTFLIAQKGALATGCEPNPEGRRWAAEMFRSRAAEATFVSTLDDIPPQSFDAVVMAEVIEHLTDPRQMLMELRAKLKPDGRCILSTPVRITERPMDAEHVQEFWPSEFHSLVAEYFDVAEQRFHMPVFWMQLYYWRPFGLPLPKAIMNMLSAWFGVRLMCGASPSYDYPTLQTIVGTIPVAPTVGSAHLEKPS